VINQYPTEEVGTMPLMVDVIMLMETILNIAVRTVVTIIIES
jgi:hypothetical protein